MYDYYVKVFVCDLSEGVMVLFRMLLCGDLMYIIN